MNKDNTNVEIRTRSLKSLKGELGRVFYRNANVVLKSDAQGPVIPPRQSYPIELLAYKYAELQKEMADLADHTFYAQPGIEPNYENGVRRPQAERMRSPSDILGEAWERPPTKVELQAFDILLAMHRFTVVDNYYVVKAIAHPDGLEDLEFYQKYVRPPYDVPKGPQIDAILKEAMSCEIEKFDAQKFHSQRFGIKPGRYSPSVEDTLHYSNAKRDSLPPPKR